MEDSSGGWDCFNYLIRLESKIFDISRVITILFNIKYNFTHTIFKLTVCLINEVEVVDFLKTAGCSGHVVHNLSSCRCQPKDESH